MQREGFEEQRVAHRVNFFAQCREVFERRGKGGAGVPLSAAKAGAVNAATSADEIRNLRIGRS